MKISLLVADDHPVVRQGVAAMLKGSDIQVVAEAETGNQAIEQAMKLKPDVVLLDVRMPDTDGLEALERIMDRSPRTKVVMFTGHENPTYVARAVALGAAGFLMKGATRDEIIAAITRAHTGLPLIWLFCKSYGKKDGNEESQDSDGSFHRFAPSWRVNCPCSHSVQPPTEKRNYVAAASGAQHQRSARDCRDCG